MVVFSVEIFLNLEVGAQIYFKELKDAPSVKKWKSLMCGD